MLAADYLQNLFHHTGGVFALSRVLLKGHQTMPFAHRMLSMSKQGLLILVISSLSAAAGGENAKSMALLAMVLLCVSF